ncbi:MAG: hypothetical protein AAF645_00840 [Myxococcota bacterium]
MGRAPRDMRRRELTVRHGARSFAAWRYTPRSVSGAMLLVPGLHFLGPADPRLDRFCRVLAHAGMDVLCPFLPDHTQLLVGENAGADSIAAYDRLAAESGVKHPGVFSISFGSRPALEVAACRDVGGLMLFGGCADWTEAVRFSLTGAPGRRHDPLNRPIVFLHLLPHFSGFTDAARTRIAAALRRQMRLTWGRMELKENDRARPFAEHVVAELTNARERELFMHATGFLPGGDERALEALETCRDAFAFLAPERWAAKVKTGLRTVAHGRSDDVIPVEHAPRLAAMLNAPCLVSGAYEHAGRGGAADFLTDAKISLETLRRMARTGCTNLPSGSY